MNIGTYLYLIILFVVFTPGIIFSIPSASSSSSSSKWVRAFTHGFLFSVAWLFTHSTVKNIPVKEGLFVVNPNITTPYEEGKRAKLPPPEYPYVDTVKIVTDTTKPRWETYLSLAEVQVYDINGVNVALKKNPTDEFPKAIQSSEGWDGKAERAIDNNTSGNYWHYSTTHTVDERPWWKLYLGASHSVQVVRVYNRTDCFWDRLNNAEVILLNGETEVTRFRLTGSTQAQTFYLEKQQQ